MTTSKNYQSKIILELFQKCNFLFFSFDPFARKRETGSKEKQEMSKLLYKMKREKKGAKKDIRADMAFLATQKAKEARIKYVYLIVLTFQLTNCL